jgi:hypothetical protein
MKKIMLPTRLEFDVITRLNRAAHSRKIPINDVISLALDGLEAEREVAQTITDRIDFLENNLGALVELMEVFGDKLDRHFSNETERLKTMYLLIKANMSDHDKAEKERFEQLAPRVF